MLFRSGREGYGLGFNVVRAGSDGRATRLRHNGASGTFAFMDLREDLLVVALTQVPTKQRMPFTRRLDAAVDAVVDIRWGKKGLFTDKTRPIPWTNRGPIDVMPRPSDEAIAATKTMCNYIWDTYGRFPATIDPFLMTVWYQAQHLDLDFYRK